MLIDQQAKYKQRAI